MILAGEGGAYQDKYITFMPTPMALITMLDSLVQLGEDQASILPPIHQCQLSYHLHPSGIQNTDSYPTPSWEPGGHMYTVDPFGLSRQNPIYSTLGLENGVIIPSGQEPGPELSSEFGIDNSWPVDTNISYEPVPTLQPPYREGSYFFLEQPSRPPLPLAPLALIHGPHESEWPAGLISGDTFEFFTQAPAVPQPAVSQSHFDPQLLMRSGASPGIDVYAAPTTLQPHFHPIASTTPDMSQNSSIAASPPQPTLSSKYLPNNLQTSEYKSGWDAGFTAGCEHMLRMSGGSQPGTFRLQASPTGLLPQLAHPLANIDSALSLQSTTNIGDAPIHLPSQETLRESTVEISNSQTHLPVDANTSQEIARNSIIRNDPPSDTASTPQGQASSSKDTPASSDVAHTHRHGHNKKRHKCDYCDKAFHKKYQLNDHIRQCR
ncbi:unnamed protein product, partial [Rhizoctonia solani]